MPADGGVRLLVAAAIAVKERTFDARDHTESNVTNVIATDWHAGHEILRQTKKDLRPIAQVLCLY